FTTSNIEGAFIVVGLFNLFLPTSPPPPDNFKLQPRYYIPSRAPKPFNSRSHRLLYCVALFYIWSLVNRSKTFDVNFLDLFSRLARDLLQAKHIPFGQHGIYTKDQSSLIFTAILRLLEIPVGQSTSPYHSGVDINSGLAMALDRDQR